MTEGEGLGRVWGGEVWMVFLGNDIVREFGFFKNSWVEKRGGENRRDEGNLGIVG